MASAASAAGAATFIGLVTLVFGDVIVSHDGPLTLWGALFCSLLGCAVWAASLFMHDTLVERAMAGEGEGLKTQVCVRRSWAYYDPAGAGPDAGEEAEAAAGPAAAAAAGGSFFVEENSISSSSLVPGGGLLLKDGLPTSTVTFRRVMFSPVRIDSESLPSLLPPMCSP